MTIEDCYDGDEITMIVIRFSGKDLKAGFEAELSEMITRQAKRWVERGNRPGHSACPIHVTVARRHDLPTGVRVAIEDDEDYILYIFDKDVISQEGADALRRMLAGRTLTWVRGAGV
ncbi:hypothetical protein ACIQ7D_18165 [Streptomyces sp. NPDC096310]|uniref:hypothetical protein n=1 Tax=Streptomyces sp. NPDC096310 TaxID=3366082 RepID=UPI0037F48D19